MKSRVLMPGPAMAGFLLAAALLAGCRTPNEEVASSKLASPGEPAPAKESAFGKTVAQPASGGTTRTERSQRVISQEPVAAPDGDLRK